MIIGIDLAALPKNPTGICIFYNANNIFFYTLYKDEEIINFVNERKPDIVAIDAPLMKKIMVRKADKILKKYGAMPPTMKSMAMLTKRAMKIVEKLNAKIIEVFPTATAKIIGIYNKNYKKMAEKMKIEVRNKHELDAYLAAYTAYLYLKGEAEEIGGKRKVIIPKIF